MHIHQINFSKGNKTKLLFLCKFPVYFTEEELKFCYAIIKLMCKTLKQFTSLLCEVCAVFCSSVIGLPSLLRLFIYLYVGTYLFTCNAEYLAQISLKYLFTLVLLTVITLSLSLCMCLSRCSCATCVLSIY